MGRSNATGMAGTADPIAELATGLAADHKAETATDAAKAKADAKVKELEEKIAAAGGEDADPISPFDDHDDGDPLNLDGIEMAAEDAELVAATLAGDIRDALLEVFKNRQKPWAQMLSEEQGDVAKALEYAAKTLIANVVSVIAAQGQPSIEAIFKGYADKAGEVTGTLKFTDVQDTDVLSLHRASGQRVLLVVASANPFMGQRAAAPVQQDQGGLDFAADEDEADEITF